MHTRQPENRAANRRGFIAGIITTLALAAGVVATFVLLSSDGQTQAATTDDDSAGSSESVAVRRGTLSSEREFNAAVSHGDPWSINTSANGTITEAHAVGTVVDFGEALAQIDDRPITLVEGDMPMYRELQRLNTGRRDENGLRLKLQTGDDVVQLQTFLIDAGFDADGKLEADGTFDRTTEKAVKAWQEATGRSPTGRVDSNQLVFEPEPVRINRSIRVGDNFAGIEVTAPEPMVLVDTSTRDRSALPVGTTVGVDVGGSQVAGTVVSQEQVDGSDGSRVWRTTITATSAGLADVSATVVTVTQIVADDVLLVPVAALLALSEGGFAVEVPDGAATRLVRVELGEVLDGNAEIRGNVRVGDIVLVAT